MNPPSVSPLINKGVARNTVKDLQNRWYDDVLRHEPDCLSVMVGINDLYGYLANAPVNISPEKFLAIYDDILSRKMARLSKCKLLLIEPFFISKENAMTSFRHDVLKLIDRPIRFDIAMWKAELFAIRLECEALYACEYLQTLW